MNVYVKLCMLVLMVALSACRDSNEFDAMGVFESDEILVSSEISGKIVLFQIREGDSLKKDEVVGEIDSTQIELNLHKLQEQIAQLTSKKIDIDTQLSPLREQIKTAEREKARVERLVKSNASTQKSLDDAVSQLDLLRKQLDSNLSSMQLSNQAIDAEIERTKIDIQIYEDNLKKSKIISPIDGVVLEKYAFEGELSSPNKALFKIANVQTLRLKAYIIDTDLTKIKLGDEVSVFSDFGKEYKEYKGKISWISDKAEFTPKTIMSKVDRNNLFNAIKIDVPNTDGLLKIGSYGEVKLNITI